MKITEVNNSDPKMMRKVFKAAADHKGTSVVEILLNCVIFANQVHTDITGKDVREDHQIYLEHGKPMIFGKDRNKGLMMKCDKMEVVTIGENGITEDDLIVHNNKDVDDTNHYRLVRMGLPRARLSLAPSGVDVEQAAASRAPAVDVRHGMRGPVLGYVGRVDPRKGVQFLIEAVTLSLFGGALWAPMTNGMIFGLAVSTVLTLVVVPTLYVLFVEKLNMRVVAD